MRKRFVSLFLVLFCVMISNAATSNAVAQSLTWCNTWEATIKTAREQNKMILVFFNGSDWSEPSRRYKKNVLLSDELARGIGDRCVAFEVDHLDFPNEQQRAAVNQRSSGLGLSTKNYPSVAFLDENAYCLFQQSGMKGTSQELIDLFNKTLDLKARRDHLRGRAANAQGDEKAKILAEMLIMLGKPRVFGSHSHNDAYHELRGLDPEDKLGIERCFTFNFDAFSEGTLPRMMNEGNTDEAIQLVEREFSDPRNNADIKQRFLAMRFYLLQRRGETKMCADTLRELIALDPSSHMASLAEGYLSFVADPIFLPDAGTWDGTHLRNFEVEWRYNVKDKITEPGSYEIFMRHTRGGDNSFRSVAFYVDDKEMVKVPVANARATIEIPSFDSERKREIRPVSVGHGWFNSAGIIEIKKL